MLICPFCKTNLEGVPDFGPNNRLCPNKECHELVTPKRVPDKEEKSEIGKDTHPDCFSYYDGRESACRRCGVREQCAIEFEATRPECYGVHPNEFEECADCLDASQCVESLKSKKVLEDNDMARKKRTRVRRRPAAEVKPEPVEEEVVVEEEETGTEDGESGEDYTEWTIPELREELEVRELATNGRKSVLVKRLMADDAELESGGDEIVEEDDDPEPEKPTRRKRTRVKDVVEEPVEEEMTVAEVEEAIPAIAAVADTAAIVDAVLLQIAQAIESLVASGTAMVAVAATGVAVAAQAEAPAEPKSKGLRGQAFWEEVCSKKYADFFYRDAGDGKAWESMTPDEKYEFADALDVDWDEHDDVRVDAIRMCKAIYAKLEITKYKDEYKTSAARNAVKA